MSFWKWLECLTVINDDPLLKRADIVIGVGIDVSADGSKASPQSKAVANKVAEIWEAGRARNVLLAGGFRLGQGKTEAELMWDEIRNRVPAGRVYLENTSVRTYQNADYTRTIMQDNCWSSAIVVAHPQQARRVKATFGKSWAKKQLRFVVIKAPSHYTGDNSQRRLRHPLNFIIWDTLAFIYSKFRGYC
jgi:uncharacterized SAM-binding protein YcdF (DUF218 family)